MINAIFFGTNVLLLFVVWHFMIKKTILDHHRDQLFDLREDVRDYFLENKIPLDSPMYRNLRDLLNGHLRFTEKISFLMFVIMKAELQTNKELHEYLRTEIEKQFFTSDEQLKQFVVEVREKAKNILTSYIVNSSGMVWLIAFAISPVVIVWNVILILRRLVSVGVNSLDGLFSPLNNGLRIIFAITQPFGKGVKKDLLEEYSFRFDLFNSDHSRHAVC